MTIRVAFLELDSRSYGPAVCQSESCKDEDVESVVLMSDGTFACLDCGQRIDLNLIPDLFCSARLADSSEEDARARSAVLRDASVLHEIEQLATELEKVTIYKNKLWAVSVRGCMFVNETLSAVVNQAFALRAEIARAPIPAELTPVEPSLVKRGEGPPLHACTPDAGDELSKLFHALWSRDVGRDGYEKRQWVQLEQLIYAAKKTQ